MRYLKGIGAASLVLVLLAIGAFSVGCGDGPSDRDKAQDVLDTVDESTTPNDLAITIQDKFDVRKDTALLIANKVIAACRPDNCHSLGVTLDHIKNTRDQDTVLAALEGNTPISAKNLPQGANPPQTGSSVQSQSQAPQASGENNTCKLINDSLVDQFQDHVSSSGSYIHFEYFERDGAPEYETLLPTAGVPGGRWDIPKGVRGHVFEYSDGCSAQQVLDQISAHIGRRLAGGFNNAGFIPWTKSVARPHSGNPEVPTMNGTSAPPAAQATGSCTNTPTTYTTQTNFTATGPAIVNAWSDNAPWKPTEVKVFIPSGTSVNFVKVGGELFAYSSSCSNQQVKDEYDNKNSYTPKTVDEMKAAGLAN